MNLEIQLEFNEEAVSEGEDSELTETIVKTVIC